MGSNTFGNLFKIITFGESHGKGIGVVIDGCPAGLEVNIDEISEDLRKRATGRNAYLSERKEEDQVEILSGLFEGKTTGAPIALFVANKDHHSSHYEPIKDLLRPGHANYTYLEKYGIFDYRGGGRTSARETVARVAAGSIAKKLLKEYGIEVLAYITQIGPLMAKIEKENLREQRDSSPLFCPDENATTAMIELIEKTKQAGDSLGGIVEFFVPTLPSGLGDPIYAKLEASLAYAMMSIPASKGFEIGSGFGSVLMSGSEHNDLFMKKGDRIETATNHSGGILGGISNGMPLIGRVAFKPTSSVRQAQETLTLEGKEASLQLPEGSRHDPCVAIRAVPVVEAMVALVLADALLLNRSARL